MNITLFAFVMGVTSGAGAWHLARHPSHFPVVFALLCATALGFIAGDQAWRFLVAAFIARKPLATCAHCKGPQHLGPCPKPDRIATTRAPVVGRREGEPLH